MGIQLRRPTPLVFEESTHDNAVTRTEYVELTGRSAVDFAASDAIAPLQLTRFVREMFGEWRGVSVAEAFAFHYDGGRTVTARDPTPDEARRHTFRRLPLIVVAFQLNLPVATLRKAEQDAVLILRVGAAANALQTVLLATRPPDATSDLVAIRDSVQRAMSVASYVVELRKVIHGDKSHKGRLWELVDVGVAARKHFPLEPIERSRDLLADDSPLAEHLRLLRNFVGFHLLPDEFRTWLQQTKDERVTLMSVPDAQRPDSVFVASVQATMSAADGAHARGFLHLAESLAKVLPYLV